MKSLIVLLLFVAAGAAQAQPYHFAPSLFDSRVGHETRAPSGDDTVRCMAIGCAEGDYERYPEYAPEREPIEEEQPFDLTAEILKRLESQPPLERAQPQPLPQSEDEARDAYYRAIRMHADGAASIEDVEAAYGHLLPYRR